MNAKIKDQLHVTTTYLNCPIGETVGKQHRTGKSTPVLSCEGACIRGEIARQAANIVAGQPGFGRACHGELFTVPHSAIAQWIHNADRVILIDGCFLNCHGRVLENMLDQKKLVRFDALSHYKKYTDIFDPEEVAYDERQSVARDVARWVTTCLKNNDRTESMAPTCKQTQTCCGYLETSETVVPPSNPKVAHSLL